MPQDSDTKTRDLADERTKVKEPSLYNVLLLNDHYTTMEFVVSVLQAVFRKSNSEAFEIMLSVHQRGSGVAGVYTRDIAETKAQTAEQLARAAGYPLRCAVEPVCSGSSD